MRPSRRAFAVWVRSVLLPGRLPGVELPESADLIEVDAMLAERVVQWTEQWKAEGRAEGLAQGEAALLKRQMKKRFGELPASAERRLAEASREQLERWAERLLDAERLEDVFD